MMKLNILNNSWWSRRTRLERKLFASTIILSFTSILVIGILIFLDYRFEIISTYLSNKINPFIQIKLKNVENSSKLTNICQTPACIDAAHTILSHIDEDVSPCHDFYKFSCGRWLNNSVIPDSKVSVSTAGDIADIMENQFRSLAEEPSKPDDPIFFRNIKTMYKSCMNLIEIERLGDYPLLDLLDQLGGWPVADQFWNSSTFDWIDTTFKLRELGLSFNTFYDISIGADYRNNTNHIITLGEVLPGIGGRKVMLNGLSDSIVSAYFGLLVESASLLNRPKDKAINEILDLLNFQIGMINITTPQEEARNLSKFYNKMNIQELQLLAPNTPWLQLFEGIFNQTIYESDEVLVHNPTYVQYIDTLLKETDKRLLANHMISSVVLSSIPLLSSKWRQLYGEYIFEISGRSAEPLRWEICTKASSSLFTAMSALYVRKYFTKESKQKVHHMVSYIREEFIKTLNNNEWMDKNTRLKAIEKAYAITTHIGYPEQLMNNSQIAYAYENLEEYSENQYLLNTLKMGKWSISYSSKQLRQTRDKNNWKSYAGAAVINAYYSSIENSMIFPAGILQGLFFNPNRPDYMNFGAIGSIIGHEYTHGFDDIGKQFDKDGNNKNWWDSETDIKFSRKTECLVNQYNNYIVPENGIQVNGIHTLAENIADNSGVKYAFKAYKAYVKDNKEQQTLPGLKYTPDQLFWLSYSNIWCTLVRPKVYRLTIAEDSHSPPQFRVIGSLSNVPEFAETFQCKKESPMNPTKKCDIW